MHYNMSDIRMGYVKNFDCQLSYSRLHPGLLVRALLQET